MDQWPPDSETTFRASERGRIAMSVSAARSRRRAARAHPASVEEPSFVASKPESTAPERRLIKLLGTLTETLTVIDDQMRMLFSTGTLNNALGYPAEFWETASVLDIVHPDDVARLMAVWERVLAHPGEIVASEARMRAADGGWAEVVGIATNLLDDPDVRGVVLTTRNVGAQRQAERLNASQQRVLELVASNGSLDDALTAVARLVDDNGVGGISMIFLFDGDRLVRRGGWANEEIEAWFEHAPVASGAETSRATRAAGRLAIAIGDVVGSLPASIAERLDIRSGWAQPIVSQHSQQMIGLIVTFCADQRAPTEHERRVGEAAATLTALAVGRARADERLAFLAHHDDLTGLANRAALFGHVERILADDRPGVELLLCDLDGFKLVNDVYGHRAGDEVLAELGRRLRAAAGPGELAARLGGDEFVVVADPAASGRTVDDVIGVVAAAIEQPVRLASGVEVAVRVSIGRATVPEDRTPEAWMHAADAEMYAKKSGR